MSLLTNLISYWALNEASGTRFDSHASNDLTDNGSVGSSTGKINSAAEFNGSNFLSCADNADLSWGSNQKTLSFWFKANSLTSNHFIVSKWPGNFGEVGVRIDSAGNIRLYAEYADFSNTTHMDSSVTATTGAWYFVVIWSDPVAQELWISVNGTVDGGSYTQGIADSGRAFIIGAADSGPNQLFDGDVDEVGLWGRVLTSGERSDLYNGGAGLAYSSFGGGITLTGAGASTGLGSATAAAVQTSAAVGVDAGYGSAAPGAAAVTVAVAGLATGCGSAAAAAAATVAVAGAAVGVGSQFGLGAVSEAAPGATAGSGVASGSGALSAAAAAFANAIGDAVGSFSNSQTTTGAGRSDGLGSARAGAAVTVAVAGLSAGSGASLATAVVAFMAPGVATGLGGGNAAAAVILAVPSSLAGCGIAIGTASIRAAGAGFANGCGAVVGGGHEVGVAAPQRVTLTAVNSSRVALIAVDSSRVTLNADGGA